MDLIRTLAIPLMEELLAEIMHLSSSSARAWYIFDRDLSGEKYCGLYIDVGAAAHQTAVGYVFLEISIIW